MELSPILTPDGRPVFIAGGEKSFKTAEHKGWIVSLEWVGSGRKAYSAMVIWPATNVLVAGEGSGMWCISRQVITDFVGFTIEGKCTGEPSKRCLKEARAALRTLGKDQGDEQALSTLEDAVVTFAPELMLMPDTPNPANEQAFTKAA